MLDFKTLGRKSANNRPNIYFSCYPGDHVFFDEIFDEITGIQDCAVFYETDYAADYDADELERAIASMQLFVIPVTERLLTMPSRARDVEIALALHHHVPILPLMQESVDMELYERIFGKLHALDKSRRDAFAIPYEEQLKRYLGTVLVDDELADKIKSAFRTRLFLSYRKIDAKVAMELIELIHSDTRFREVAIWFDNFLTPGEDYENNIKAALEESDIFSLVVTPNIYQPNAEGKPNYVMEHEYPDAKRLKGDDAILPIEMTETDKAELFREISDLPRLADRQNAAEELYSLLKVIAGDKLTAEEKDLYRSYLMGMGYLNGVCVERNIAIATKMITECAEKLLPKAIEKIVEMYEKGIGFERNYDKAIEWQKVLIEIRERIANETGTAEDRRNLSVSYTDLGDMYKDQERLDEAMLWYRKSLEIREQLARETGTTQSRRYLSISYERIGNIYRLQFKYNEALQWYRKFLEIAEHIANGTNAEWDRKALSICYDRIGEIYRAQGDYGEALQWYEQAFNIAERIAESTDITDDRRNVGIFYERIGSMYEMQGRLNDALQQYISSNMIMKQLADETASVESRRDLSISYVRIGSIYMAKGNFDEALSWYEKSLAIKDSLATETDTVQSRNDLSFICNTIGDTCKQQRRYAEAILWYRKVIDICKQHVNDTGTVEARRSLSIGYNRIGAIYEILCEFDEAMIWYKKSFEIREQLANETGTADAQKGLGISYGYLGCIYLLQNKHDKALQCFKKALELFRHVAEEIRTPENYDYLAGAYIQIAGVSKRNEKRKYLRSAFDIYSLLIKACPDKLMFTNNRDFVANLLRKLED